MSQIITLFLTCSSLQEADVIAKSLLEKKLVACVKTSPVNSQFLWNGKIDSSAEILLLMESVQQHIQIIEVEIKKLHSYSTFVLIALPTVYVSAQAKAWIEESCL